MRAIVLMFDSLNRHMLPPYGETFVDAPNFARLAERAVTFDNFYAGSMPCIPARREMHTGRYNFLHRSWGPLEPFDDSAPQLLGEAGVHTHLVSDHPHYWEDGGATYHTRFTTWEFMRGQEGDPWKGVVEPGTSAPGIHRMRRQDQINRRYMRTEAEHSQTRTVDAGMEFLQTNVGADRWMLQIELFDPHEPFFSHQTYKDRYPHSYDGPEFDWPAYRKVYEPDDQVKHAQMEYAALVSMCDHSLGRVLDFMDAHDMWDDTMLIVNTDHGFLLGEHGWWAKGVQPWFNELVHLPFFAWDPRCGERGTRRAALTQTIDIAPTILAFFGVDPAPDMQGQDLARVLADDGPVRDGALFGVHGGHVNVTDGRYVYMRASDDERNLPLEEYTLMPTHMRTRFGIDELTAWEPAEPFGFTKGVRTMRMPATSRWMNPWRHGTLLFDLESDPGQERPIADDDVELRMLRLLTGLMRENDAPASQFRRLGIPADGEAGPDHLHVRSHRARADALAEPLPVLSGLAARDLLERPLAELLQDPAARHAVERHAPELVQTELIAVPASASLLDLAARAAIPAGMLRRLDSDLATLPVS
ncbi:sulfatase [Phytoactinopolyspora halotolerans]|uniref:Sulfatase n=1 Tax=Phytoactinopolyspora halotolerans TaxID=1981512 RepID=A0A6L9SGQ4_9ACTN|nr:sulfatase [Phytoactinopolyspora halotolerans]NEE04349.1 sulfatase [Phytoactinopolyspora halotolerans]